MTHEQTLIPTPKVYVFHNDPGHGWLAVKMKEILELGIEKDISTYSYIKGNTVYLEEDCDAGLFFNAMKKKGFTVSYRSSHKEKTSIRSYDYYTAPKMVS